MKSLLLATVVLGAIACGQPDADSPPLGRTASAVVGGTETSADPAIVAIYVGPVQACSGSLINKNTVLTAGHCAVSDALLDVPGVSIVFGPEAEDDDAREIDVKSWKLHPKYGGEGNPYDVALFTLEEDVNDVAFMTLIDAPLPDSAVGTMIRHVGYGENDEKDESGEGIKRTATYPITRIDPLMLWSGAPGEQTCQGDSGGPGLVNVGDGEKIVGVVSGGPNCHDDGSDARVDVAEVHDWIVQTANLPVPLAATPTTDAGADAAPAEATSAAPTTASDAPTDDGTRPAPAVGAEPSTASGCNVGWSRPDGPTWLLVLVGLGLVFRRRR